MAEAENHVDQLCCEFFKLNVEKELARKLTDAEEKKGVEGKGTTVRKILKDMGENSTTIQLCEASVMAKHQDRTTKKIKGADFVKKVLPDLAVQKTKSKSVDDPKAKEELDKMKKKICSRLEEAKKGPGKEKSAAVVDRLTDTSKYTGSHQSRFDDSGKGKGKSGREDMVDGSGYVGNYKGAGTFDKKK